MIAAEEIFSHTPSFKKKETPLIKAFMLYFDPNSSSGITFFMIVTRKLQTCVNGQKDEKM